MTHFNFQFDRGPDHKRLITWLSLVLVTLGYLSGISHAQTAVTLAPVPQLQFFDQSGTPLAFGCVFTYETNSSTPLTTYTDYSGVTQNANPVILTGGGSANIWLLAGQAYAFRVMSAGGTNCASGSTLYTVNGIGGGSTTLTTIVPYSATPAFQVAAQNQLFEITLTGNASAQPLTFVGITPPSYITFQITQDSSGSHTWSWPANSVGGCTINPAANSVTQQVFIYNGSDATAVGPCTSGGAVIVGNLTATSITDLGTLTVDGFSLLNGFFGCVEGVAPSPISGDDLMWCDSTAHRWSFSNDGGSADVIVGENTTDTLTNKTYDTAGTGNVLKINGNQVTAATGTGGSSQTAVLNGNPTLAGWNCAITSETTTYKTLASDCIVHVSAASSSWTLSLDHTLVGQYWEIVRTDSTSTHVITVEGDSGNVNGIASITLAPEMTVLCHADGTNSWCAISVFANGQLIQYGADAGCTGTGCSAETFPIQYQTAVPTCFCTGINGSCNLQTGGASKTSCAYNASASGGINWMAIGIP